MKVSLALNNLTALLYQAHEEGSAILGHSSMPCSLCREILEQGKGTTIDGELVLVRDHFHGGDFGKCARKLFWEMTRGRVEGFMSFTFLIDGHLHEKSMLTNIEMGLPEGYKILILDNMSEQITELLGWKLVTHCDGYLLDEKGASVAILECKAIKPKYFDEIKKKQEIRDEWYGQGQSYLFALGEQVLLFIVKNREDSKIHFPIQIDKDMDYIAKRINKLNEVFNRIKNNLGQPDGEHRNPKDFECQFCPYNKECWGV